MGFRHFLYRQKNRWRYHIAKDEVRKRLAEINRHNLSVESKGDYYHIPEASLSMPKGLMDHIFVRFDLLIKNMHDLNGRYVWESGKLFFVFGGLKVRIVSVNELFIINEVFFNHCYNFRPTRGLRYNVIDIGMNVGLASLFFANQEYVNHVFSFEPSAASFEQALINVKANSHLAGKIEAFNFGLGRGDKKERIFYNPLASGTSGQFAQNHADDRFCEVQPIVIKDALETISKIIKDNGDFRYLLKIDCEGAEYEIMDSLMERGFPPEIEAILMEWHGAMSENLATRISNAGFKMVFTRLKNNLGLIYAFR